MPVAVPLAVAGATLVSGAMSSRAQSKAGDKAAQIQADASSADIAMRQRQFGQIQELLKPYTQAATGSAFNGAAYLAANPDVAADPYYSQNPEEHYTKYGKAEGRAHPGGAQGALGAQQDLLGLSGADAQQAAIAALERSPQFTAMQQQGENAILANASATGGLRGGNTQAALAQFRPQVLSQLIGDQYSRLGGLVSIGQNAAAGVGNAGMATANGIGGALQQQGAALAGGALAQGRGQAGLWNAAGNAIGAYFGMKGGF